MSWSHLPPALDTVTDTHRDRRVEGVRVGFEETLVEKGPELGRQNPSCTQKTERKNGDSSTPKSVLHYSRNGRQNPKGSNRFPSWERPMDGWVTWAQ